MADNKSIFLCNSPNDLYIFQPIINNLNSWTNIIYFNPCDVNSVEIKKTLKKLDLKYETTDDFSSKILKRENPDVVIVKNDQNPFFQVFIHTANSQSIPTLMIQDGILTYNSEKNSNNIDNNLTKIIELIKLPSHVLNFFLFSPYSLKLRFEIFMCQLKFSDMNKTLNGQGFCSITAVFGNYTKDLFVSKGIDPEKIEVTGNPKFDEIYYNKFKDKKEILKKYGFIMDQKYVIFLSQPYVELGLWEKKQKFELIKAIDDAIENLKGTKLIIKPHPRENLIFYEEIVSNLHSTIVAPIYSNTHELINISDLAITVDSSTGLEAIITGTPLITVNLFNNLDNNYYKDLGITCVQRKDDIFPAIKNYIVNKNFKINNYDDIIMFHAYKQDGKASERISNIIKKLAKGNNDVQL